jgi:carbamoyltransferase
MITWGISANSHDAALSVFKDEELVFASHSERFSKIKNDPNLDKDLVRYAKQWGYPDLVCWYEKPWLKTLRQLYSGQGLLLQENNIKKYLQNYNIKAPIVTQEHHRSHAAAGYFTSKFDNACVLVIDAIGEFETLTIWKAQGNTLKKVYKQQYPHSLGLWYSAMTQRCGLKPNEEEYILMGMSALGDPDRLTSTILKDFFSWSWPQMFTLKNNLHKGCKDWRPDLTSQQDLYDIAAGTQAAYEVVFSKMLHYAKHITGSNNLVFMGGCALNCVANNAAYDFFDNVWIMPNPGDAGSSIGAVLSHWNKHIQWTGADLGYDMGNDTPNSVIVDYLLKNKICGIARGRAEFGPRALGNRSLIADPRGNDIKDKVNAIKRREEFRPFAPAILEELASQYFDIPAGRSSDYMQMVYTCRNPELYPAIVHIDGTSRVQTVPKDGSQFRQLLELWYATTGCPMLLNTSLNIKGQPMINDYQDSLDWSEKYGLPVFN